MFRHRRPDVRPFKKSIRDSGDGRAMKNARHIVDRQLLTSVQSLLVPAILARRNSRCRRPYREIIGRHAGVRGEGPGVPKIRHSASVASGSRSRRYPNSGFLKSWTSLAIKASHPCPGDFLPELADWLRMRERTLTTLRMLCGQRRPELPIPIAKQT